MGRKSPGKLETDGIQLKNENHSYENLQNSQNHPIREEILSHKRDIWPMSSREYGTINQRKIILFSLFLLTLTLKEYEKADNLLVNRETRMVKEHRTSLTGLGKMKNLNLNAYQ